MLSLKKALVVLAIVALLAAPAFAEDAEVSLERRGGGAPARAAPARAAPAPRAAAPAPRAAAPARAAARSIARAAVPQYKAAAAAPAARQAAPKRRNVIQKAAAATKTGAKKVVKAVKKLFGRRKRRGGSKNNAAAASSSSSSSSSEAERLAKIAALKKEIGVEQSQLQQTQQALDAKVKPNKRRFRGLGNDIRRPKKTATTAASSSSSSSNGKAAAIQRKIRKTKTQLRSAEIADLRARIAKNKLELAKAKCARSGGVFIDGACKGRGLKRPTPKKQTKRAGKGKARKGKGKRRVQKKKRVIRKKKSINKKQKQQKKKYIECLVPVDANGRPIVRLSQMKAQIQEMRAFGDARASQLCSASILRRVVRNNAIQAQYLQRK